jgi:uncharacterized membrane protein
VKGKLLIGFRQNQHQNLLKNQDAFDLKNYLIASDSMNSLNVQIENKCYQDQTFKLLANNRKKTRQTIDKTSRQ